MSRELLVLDRALALSRVGGDEELLREIAELFLDDYPNLLGQIHQAVESRDPQGLERASHSLKGSVANFGAEPAYQAALELERLARSRNLAGVGAALQKLESDLAELRPELIALANPSR
jgi:two-component system, sensor histidine kinase and response regulator